jgi:hypothetical protein
MIAGGRPAPAAGCLCETRPTDANVSGYFEKIYEPWPDPAPISGACGVAGTDVWPPDCVDVWPDGCVDVWPDGCVDVWPDGCVDV